MAKGKIKGHTQGKCSFCHEWQYMERPEVAVKMPRHTDPNTGRNCYGMGKGPVSTR